MNIESRRDGTTDPEFNMKKPSMQIGLGVALGAGIGAAVSVALGIGAAWLGIGIAIGIAIGASMSKTKAGSSPLEAVRNDRKFEVRINS
jgi:hypothetical protein